MNEWILESIFIAFKTKNRIKKLVESENKNEKGERE